MELASGTFWEAWLSRAASRLSKSMCIQCLTHTVTLPPAEPSKCYPGSHWGPNPSHVGVRVSQVCLEDSSSKKHPCSVTNLAISKSRGELCRGWAAECHQSFSVIRGTAPSSDPRLTGALTCQGLIPIAAFQCQQALWHTTGKVTGELSECLGVWSCICTMISNEFWFCSKQRWKGTALLGANNQRENSLVWGRAATLGYSLQGGSGQAELRAQLDGWEHIPPSWLPKATRNLKSVSWVSGKRWPRMRYW